MSFKGRTSECGSGNGGSTPPVGTNVMDLRRSINISGLSSDEAVEVLPEGLVVLGYRGSIAHGMYVPQSNPDSIDDKDLMGVFVGPEEHYLGFGRRDTYERFHREFDVVSYELRKFVGLLLNCNPNVLSMLWMEPKSYIYIGRAGQALINNRQLFVSKKAYHSFSGYAHSQFKRMTHYKFEGYMGEKRKTLVDRFGYDTKNAAHLIRLLKMGIEFLTEGVLYVERKDAAELLSIKHGEWPLERVKERAEGLFALAEEAYVRSPLPPEPDRAGAERLLIEILGEFRVDWEARRMR
jgi:predicted nucleotidyltransferase